MNILYLTFYYKPDISAGSFRNTTLVKELSLILKPGDNIHVVTTMPNRYQSYLEKTVSDEKEDKIEITRISLPHHESGFLDQTIAFKTFFFRTIHLTKGKNYDLVFASSSRLFTAFLGSIISRKKGIPLYLDIRDIFVDTLHDVIKNPVVKWALTKSLRPIENYTFSRANHINLISGGFKSYFEKFNISHISYFSNGIDKEFLEMSGSSNWPKDEYIITYAGNIGEGQGLHKIIPQAALLLGPKYFFRIIGDGGLKEKLKKQLQVLGVSNVELYPPMSREDLKKFYATTHFLILHLNDYKSFEKVLPSKIFEYCALDKPILAGVSGYAATFIKNNCDNCILFSPGDVSKMVNKLKSYSFRYEERLSFRKEFERSRINAEMAKSIISYLYP